MDELCTRIEWWPYLYLEIHVLLITEKTCLSIKAMYTNRMVAISLFRDTCIAHYGGPEGHSRLDLSYSNPAPMSNLLGQMRAKR